MSQADLEVDIRANPQFIDLMADAEFCAEFWTAFANVTWYKKFDQSGTDSQKIIDSLIYDMDDEDRHWGASFRGMGGVIADLRNEFHGTSEDYMDWYCCNIKGGFFLDDDDDDVPNAPYGYVTARIREALNAMGWFPVEDEYYIESNP